MKKLIVFLVIVLIALYAGLAVLGAGGEYAAEKMFYKIMKNASTVSLNPDAAPPAQLAVIEGDLKLLLKKYPDTKPARLSHIALVEFYITNKRFDDAMSMIQTTNKAYGSDTDILSTAQFLKGTIYEKEGKWNKAVEEFNILKEKYPATQLGMQIPIYIGKYYNSKGSYAEAKDAYESAAAFYRKMEKQYSGKMLGYTSSILLIQTYLSLEDYNSAGETLGNTLRNYSSALSFSQLMPQIDNIYVKNLKEPAKAIEIYKYMVSVVKNSRMKKYLNKKIENLEAGK